jgi:pimeloyl-ACP methyl ester carboxylesterase
MPFIKAGDGTQIFYRESGTGAPVVLIHGWPLNGDMWEYQVPALVAAGNRVITYDRRGFGQSDQPWTGYDYDTFADDLAALLDGLDLNGVTLVGFSMGGGEIARYIGRHGTARIAKTVLVGAVTPFLLKTPDHENGAPQSVFDEMVEGLSADRPHFLAGFGKTFFGVSLLNAAVSAEMLDWAQLHALKASPKGTIDCVRAFSETDFRADLPKFDKPTLIIHGDDDQTVPIDISAREAVKLIPAATLKEYEGAPHGLFITHKDQLNADLVAFIGGRG